MVLLGLTSAVLLVVWGLLAATGSGGIDPSFWLVAAAFLVYIVWDVRRHLKAIRAQAASREGRNP